VAAAKQSIKVSFVMERETKNTFRYAEDVDNADDAVIGSLYIQKKALPEGDAPAKVSLVITLG